MTILARIAPGRRTGLRYATDFLTQLISNGKVKRARLLGHRMNRERIGKASQ